MKDDRKMTAEEVEALMVLVRAGWLKVELNPKFLPESPVVKLVELRDLRIRGAA